MKKMVSFVLIAVCIVGAGALAMPGAECAQEQVVTEEAVVVNINSADKDALLSIRGIGPTLAERIIAYRGEYGPFAMPEDIKNVPGIGDVKFQQIQAVIAV